MKNFSSQLRKYLSTYFLSRLYFISLIQDYLMHIYCSKLKKEFIKIAKYIFGMSKSINFFDFYNNKNIFGMFFFVRCMECSFHLKIPKILVKENK